MRGVKMLKALSVLLLVGWIPGVALADDFAGRWEVTKVVESKKKGFPWSLEVKYPKSMTLDLRDGHLAGTYVDQSGYSGTFELAAIVNQGRDLLLVHGGAGTKSPEALSPIHHIKLRDGKLYAVVTSHDMLFEWVAERR